MFNRGWQPPPKIQAQQLEEAKKFYYNDNQLAEDERRQLARYFWQRANLYPTIALPTTIGFMVLPSYLKKIKVLPPKGSYRFMQTCLAFIGLFSGVQLGGSIASFVQTRNLQSDAAIQSYKLLSRYPSQLGSAYYSMTVMDKNLKFGDPEFIDWKKTPIFPMAILMNPNVVEKVTHEREEQYEKYEKRKEEHIKSVINSREHGKTPLQGNSWDKIIESNNPGQEMQPVVDDFTDSEKKWN